ncbi:unnamed protein product [Allacma fusca]|uniref:Uncharacterized protein n=1 Tax=Allacma fusca TaxID=39272 RepID=A0A8J2JNT4_9HEXA|nr:unnamed protein product [Allacma fusca]
MSEFSSRSTLSSIRMEQMFEATHRSKWVLTNTENEELRLRKLRCDCGWFQYLKVMSFYVSNTFAVPWRFCFQKDTQTFHIASPRYQKYIWIFAQLVSLTVARYRLYNAVHIARTSKNDTFAYFDLCSMFGIYAFEFACKGIWWFKRAGFQDFVDEVQNSPLLKIASHTSRRVRCIFYL